MMSKNKFEKFFFLNEKKRKKERRMDGKKGSKNEKEAE